MGFGGAVAGMITSLKNNKRARKSRFDEDRPFYSNKSSKPFIDHTKATPQQLQAIKNKLKLQRRKNNHLIYGMTSFIILLLITAMILFL